MKCPECGREVLDDQKYCYYCGCPLDSEPQEVTAEVVDGENPKKKGLFTVENRQDPFTWRRYLLGIGLYFVTIYFLVSVIQIFLIFLYEPLTGLSAITTDPATGKDIYTEGAANFVNIWTQVLTYGLLFAGLVVLFFKTLKSDLIYSKKHLTLLFASFGIGCAGIYVTNIGINILYTAIDAFTNLGLTTGESGNQEGIVDMFKGCNNLELALYCIVLVIIAPLIEELIFRKAMFKCLRKLSKPGKVIISAVLFGGLHIATSILNILVAGGIASEMANDILVELLFGIQYMAMGAVLGIVYQISNENIYSSYLVHLGNNLLSVIALFLL